MKSEVSLFGQPFGTLNNQTKDGRAAFAFHPEYGGVSPSPFFLPTTSGLLLPDPPLQGLHGLFADSLPDAFGMGALDQWFRQHHLNPETISSLERLCYLGQRGFGALTYHPDLSSGDKDFTKALHEISLEQAARATMSGKGEEVIEEFLLAASSPGGARPKIAVGIDLNDPAQICVGLWNPSQYRPGLLKIDVESGRSYGRIESAYLNMAQASGLEVPPHRLIEQGDHAHLLMDRFDWEAGQRLHLHSVAGLLHRDFSRNETSYLEVMVMAKRLSGKVRDSQTILHRGMFNYLAGNCDDHAKNHAFLMDTKGQWRPSPSYDLTPSKGIGSRGIHAMSMGPSFNHQEGLAAWVKLGEMCHVSKEKVRSCWDQTCAAVSKWSEFADEAKIPRWRAQETSANLCLP